MSNNETPHDAPRRQISKISSPQVKSGVFGASSNLVNAIVGAGIIGIPYAIRESGFVVGVLLILLVGYLTDKSLRIIVEVASFHKDLRQFGVKTYEDLLMIPFGTMGTYFVLVNMFILAYGAMVAYLLIIKDTVPVVLGLQTVDEDDVVEREVVMIVFSLAIMVPLSMLRDMASLAFTSMISVMADIVLVAIIIVFSPVPSTVENAGGIGAVIKDDWINSKLFIGLGVLSTAMACQHSAFIVATSLQDCTPQRWSSVTFRSIGTATILCILLGVTGYLGFLQATQGDILNNFDSDSLTANAGRTLLAITMFLTYPMESFVARHVLVQLFYNGDMDNQQVGSNGESLPENKLFGLIGRREKVTFGIYIITLIPALFVDDLGPVLSLTGSIGASCLAYIGPGLVYLGVNGREFLEFTNELLRQKGYTNEVHVPKPSAAADDGDNPELELPVVGDADARMSENKDQLPSTGSRPWWWWTMGWPLWIAISSTGAKGMAGFLNAERQQTATRNSPTHENYEPHVDDIVKPNARDFYLSMVFIIFGVIAAVLGVISNIYVQVNNVFYTPT